MWYVLEAPRGMELASKACATARKRGGAQDLGRVGRVIFYIFYLLRHDITALFWFASFEYVARLI